jgi:hypothetical protein
MWRLLRSRLEMGQTSGIGQRNMASTMKEGRP